MLLRQTNGNYGNQPVDSSVRNLILSEMEASAPILNYAEFYSMAGSADTPRKNADASGGGVRAINSDFSNNFTAPEFANVALKIFGDKIQTDVEYEARGTDLPSEHLNEIRSFAKNLGKDFQDRFINDIVDSTHFAGIKSLATGSQLLTYDAAGDGVVPFGSTTANIAKQRAFLEQLDELISNVDGGAQVLMMDAKTRNRLRTIGRDFIQVVTVKDALGINQILDSYNGIPIVISGFKKGNSGLVIPHDETVGEGESVRISTTSIYAMRFGEKQDLSLATNVGLRVEGPTREKVFIETYVQLSCGTVLINDKALARLQGIVIS